MSTPTKPQAVPKAKSKKPKYVIEIEIETETKRNLHMRLPQNAFVKSLQVFGQGKLMIYLRLALGATP